MRDGWEYKKLGEVCEILDKQRKPVTKSNRLNGVYPYYGATGIQDYVADYIFDGRFVLIGEDGAKWGSCEKTAFIIEGKSWVNNHAHILKLNNNIVDAYVVYYLNYSNLDSYITGAVVRKLTQASMKNIPIPLPPLSVQQSIVAELDKINEIIDMKKAQLKDLDLLAQSIFYDMFGDPIENPKGWEVKKLGEVCTIVRGGSPRPIQKYLGGNIPWIKIGDATDGDDIYLHQTKEHIIEDGLKKTRYIKAGSLIFANCGVSLSFARIITFDGCIHDGWLALENIVDNTDKVFLLKSLNECTNYFRRTAPDGTQPNLNTGIMKSFKQIIPPKEMQLSYLEKIQAIESQKSAIKQSLAEVETLLASRMDYYFN